MCELQAIEVIKISGIPCVGWDKRMRIREPPWPCESGRKEVITSMASSTLGTCIHLGYLQPAAGEDCGRLKAIDAMHVLQGQKRGY